MGEVEESTAPGAGAAALNSMVSEVDRAETLEARLRVQLTDTDDSSSSDEEEKAEEEEEEEEEEEDREELPGADLHKQEQQAAASIASL